MPTRNDLFVGAQGNLIDPSIFQSSSFRNTPEGRRLINNALGNLSSRGSNRDDVNRAIQMLNSQANDTIQRDPRADDWGVIETNNLTPEEAELAGGSNYYGNGAWNFWSGINTQGWGNLDPSEFDSYSHLSNYDQNDRTQMPNAAPPPRNPQP